MSLLISIVLVIIIVSIISTLLIAFTGKGDEDYSESTKRNTTNLTLIYAIIIPLSFIALSVFIIFFT
jgi:hypothetical protein